MHSDPYAPARGSRADTERRIWQGIGEAHGRGRADLSWLDQARLPGGRA